MPINHARGDMYPFVDATHNPIKGGCHEILHGFGCRYCFMKFGERAKSQYYQGPLTLYPKELQSSISYRPGKTYFIGSAADMWHPNVSDDDIAQVLSNCDFHSRMTPGALEKPTFMFQSKNPSRFHKFLGEMPESTWLATTVETDDVELYGDMSRAPSPVERVEQMRVIYSSTMKPLGCQFVLSVEPVIQCTDKFRELLLQVPWDMVSIGADTCGVIKPENEPLAAQITQLAEGLEAAGVKVCIKNNCQRLLKSTAYGTGLLDDWKRAGWIMERKKPEKKVPAQLFLL